MCEIFAFSSSAPTRVRFALEEFRQHGCAKGPHCDGWGLAFVASPYAQVFREVAPAAYSEWMEFLINHQHYSQCVISHIRRATQGGVNLQNTQPFSRECHGVRHVFAHNGDLKNWQVDDNLNRFTPIGDTDSELAFCQLMERIYSMPQEPLPTLNQRLTVLELLLGTWSKLGPANIVYTDGDYLYAFANRRTQLNGKVEPPGTMDSIFTKRVSRFSKWKNCPPETTLERGRRAHRPMSMKAQLP